jgi:hypothetical protein
MLNAAGILCYYRLFGVAVPEFFGTRLITIISVEMRIGVPPDVRNEHGVSVHLRYAIA